MEVIYHPLVRGDILEILRYYHPISPRLAEDLQEELRALIDRIAANPLRFPLTDRGFRRANLRRFPHHVLYEIHETYIRVMVVRHNKRHPNYQLDRE